MRKSGGRDSQSMVKTAEVEGPAYSAISTYCNFVSPHVYKAINRSSFFPEKNRNQIVIDVFYVHQGQVSTIKVTRPSISEEILSQLTLSMTREKTKGFLCRIMCSSWYRSLGLTSIQYPQEYVSSLLCFVLGYVSRRHQWNEWTRC
jgi:hypothetical protein